MRRLLSLVLPCLLVVAAGCGADDVNPNALAEAADATRAQGGVHMTATATVRSQGQSVPLKMEGDADLKGKRARIRATGEGTPPVETIMDGTTMYMKMEGFEKALGAEWAKIDMAEVGESTGVDFEQMMQMSSADPAEQLEFLRAAADLEEVGEEDVDGVATTHYKGAVDLRKYPGTLPEDERESARRSVERLIELAGTSRFPTEVWIDDENLVRRQKLTTSQKRPFEMTMAMDMRFSDFGKRVSIEPPDDAKDVTELAKKGAAQQGP